jgi:hypothetical protein
MRRKMEARRVQPQHRRLGKKRAKAIRICPVLSLMRHAPTYRNIIWRRYRRDRVCWEVARLRRTYLIPQVFAQRHRRPGDDHLNLAYLKCFSFPERQEQRLCAEGVQQISKERLLRFIHQMRRARHPPSQSQRKRHQSPARDRRLLLHRSRESRLRGRYLCLPLHHLLRLPSKSNV